MQDSKPKQVSIKGRSFPKVFGIPIIEILRPLFLISLYKLDVVLIVILPPII